MKATVIAIQGNSMSVRPHGEDTMETCTVAPDRKVEITRNGKKCLLKELQPYDTVEFEIADLVIAIVATGEEGASKKSRLTPPIWNNGRWVEK